MRTAMSHDENTEKATWTTPEAEEVKMDAEIGSYQGDDAPPFVEH
jgi:hypothetical protein